MKTKLISAAIFAIFWGQNSVAQEAKKPLYLDVDAPIEARVEDALSRLTLEEKVALCHAQSKFSSAGVPRLGIPENWMTDGPHGIRPEVLWDEWDQAGWTNDKCTAFPALTGLAATWNPEMAHLYGVAIGQEARYRNKNVLLGPGVNIYRTPLNGRNFEYMGEDPFLASRMVVPYVRGVQSQSVAACVKHFALNNQEKNRHTVNVKVDDRALYEIYLPAFKAAVLEGKTWAIMPAYNRYKGEWACQNKYLLQDILRKEWGFDGVTVSDWGGVNNTEAAALNGLDMEFGTWTDGMLENKSNAYDNYFLADPFLKKLKSGEYNEKEVLDPKVRNILRLIFRTTMSVNRPFGQFASPEHFEIARKIGDEAIVLLKNEKNILPIDPKKVKKIAVIGENAIKMMTIGGGSSQLKAAKEVSPLDGLKARFANQVKVEFARGYSSDDYKDQDGLKGNDITDHRPADEMQREAIALAKNADVVVFIGGLNKHDGQDCEGNDRKSYGLPYGQDALISALAKANKRLVVVLISGNATAMPWERQVPVIVQDWYLGSEAGTSLADVLSGDVNPSGKLPFTFPVKLEDNPAIALGEYPGGDDESYNEGILVGYRYADTKGVKPLFAFGHGLSYTTFAYGKLQADKPVTIDGNMTFQLTVKNTGKRAGAEVVQLYIRDVQSSLPRPYKELKAFQKVFLQPNESKTVTFTIDKAALSFFDSAKHQWVAESGIFEAIVGSSSADLRGRVTFDLK